MKLHASLVQLQWESPQGELVASSGVWGLVGRWQQSWGCRREQRSPSGAASSLPTLVPLLALRGTERPGTPGSWEGRLAHTLWFLPHLCLCSCPGLGGVVGQLLVVWCVPHVSAFPFLSFTESPCEGK
ncbi:hypothetical protein EK904_011945, partial [Melospiza melodia maxima]